VNRRAFIAGTVALLAARLAAEAQPAGKVYRLAIVATTLPVAEYTADPALRAFFVELRRLGYVEGQNLVVELRSALGRPERFPEIAAEVVSLNPDVILAGSNRVLRAFKAVTANIPIVGPSLSFPVEYGLATSLARPGANLTGLTDDAGPQIYAKGLELLREAVPGISRVANLTTTTSSNGPVGTLQRDGARRLGVTLVPAPMDGPFQEAQYQEAFQTMTRNGAQAVLIGNIGEHFANRRLIVELATRHRLPTIAPGREFVSIGSLMSYGVSYPDNWRRAATYVDKILKGAQPADLPIQEPTKFDLVINLKTAKALGLTIPPSVLARADEVIQ
jgi:putative ABC transport system substrate-binding protein